MEGPAPVTAAPVDLLYTDTERSLASALDDILAARSGPAGVIARTEQPETYDVGLWKALASDIGIGGLLISEALGGAGASYREVAAAAERFGAYVAPVPYLGSAVVATAVTASALAAAASAAAGGPPAAGASAAARMLAAARQRATEGSDAASAAGSGSGAGTSHVGAAADLLRRLADGTVTAALAVPVDLAPGAPFPVDAHLSGTQAGDRQDGTFRLRGTIRSVADALPADVLLVPAEGVPNGLYLVEAAAAGVHRSPVTSLDMTRQLCDISLDGAPARQVAVGTAAAVAVEAGLVAGAVILAAEQLGLAQRCLDMTVAYVKERRQFARQIGSFQGLKHRLADLWATIAQARAASRYAAACLAAGDPDTAVALALAKATCCEASVTAAQECVQMHGGIGFTWEHPAHLYLKRAKAASVAFGTPGAHRAALADLVNLPA
jgi:alkylation response protein AidB-like acyl-CoA dehydrogenase